MKRAAIILNLIMISNLGLSQEPCNESILNTIPGFSNYTWESETQKAKITLSDGGLLSITTDGCLEVSGKGDILYTNTERKIDDEHHWLSKSLWLFKRIFSQEDYELIQKSVASRDYQRLDDWGRITLVFRTEKGTAVVYVKDNGPKSIKYEFMSW